MGEDIRSEILRDLEGKIRHVTAIFVTEFKPAHYRDESAPKLLLNNFQGSIYITAQPWGLHVFKTGYAKEDAVFDYEDPDYPEKVIARCLYLQDIDHHLKNRKIREERERQQNGG